MFHKITSTANRPFNISASIKKVFSEISPKIKVAKRLKYTKDKWDQQTQPSK